MGPINRPIQPVGWRIRDTAPFGGEEHGIELLGKTDADGKPVVYWAKTREDAWQLAEDAGHRL